MKASNNHGDDTSSSAATYNHHPPSSNSIYTHKMIVWVHAVVVESCAAQNFHLWPVRCSVCKWMMFRQSQPPPINLIINDSWGMLRLFVFDAAIAPM
jgi:hypothetical protein